MHRPFTALALGRVFFGAGVMAMGAMQLAAAEFVRLVPKLPAWVPAQPALATAAGAVLVAVGLAIVGDRFARAAASVVAVMVIVVVPLLHLPHLIWNPVVDRPFLRGFMWTSPLKALALGGGAVLLARNLRGDVRLLARVAKAAARLEPLGAVMLALFLAVCGIQHFVYRDFVMLLVPAWIPGARFWTYFTGMALMAGGAGILVPRTARLAATLSGVMILLWVPLLHVPRAIAGPRHFAETAGVFEALAISGVAFIVAGTRSARPGERDPARAGRAAGD